MRISGATLEGVRQRFVGVHAALPADRDPWEINVRIAGLTPQDGAAELVERADADPPNRRAEWGTRRPTLTACSASNCLQD